MKEVTISVKTTFRLIKELSGLPSTDERVGLVNLLSREALGDIKAEEKLVVHDHTDCMNRLKIANALGMPWMSDITTDAIVKFINDNCTKGAMENIRLLEALRSQLSVQQWDQMSGALANLKQRVVEAEKSHEILEKVEAFLTNSSSLYPAHYSPASHQERWHMGSELLAIIKGKYAVCSPAQKAADEASNPLRMAEAKISELEAQLAHANRVVQDVRNAVSQPHQYYACIVRNVMEALG